MKLQTSIYLTAAVLALGIHVATSPAAEATINPTGVWKVITSSTNKPVTEPGVTPPTLRPVAQTLKLKLNGDTLTGTLTYNSSAVVNGKARISEAPITKAKLAGTEISFNFTHPPSSGKGPNANYSYRGKFSGDTIKGTVTMEWMDHTSTKLWEADRLKE
jgi:hypothetical protein